MGMTCPVQYRHEHLSHRWWRGGVCQGHTEREVRFVSVLGSVDENVAGAELIDYSGIIFGAVTLLV
jgi:hypothetical protein